MDQGSRHANQLGEFLKARRAQLTPAEVGLPVADSRRRVTGLRREEVAQLASISVDYLSRLERGRVPASPTVLATLAQALRLGDDQRAYMYRLAGKAPATKRRPTVQKVRPAMRRLLDQLTETPALVIGKCLDILAWNPMASALYTDFEAYPAAAPELPLPPLQRSHDAGAARGLERSREHLDGLASNGSRP